VFKISGTVGDHNPIFWILKHTIVMLCFLYIYVFLLCKKFVEVFVVLDSYVLHMNKFFYVMCCKYVDNNN